MQYMQDNGVRPSVFEKMNNVEPKILYARGDGTFLSQVQTHLVIDIIELMTSKEEIWRNIGQISKDFEINWPNMSNKEKCNGNTNVNIQIIWLTISSVDDNVGRVLDYLEDTGLDKNTIVVYTSDQGFTLVSMAGLIKDLFMINLLKHN